MNKIVLLKNMRVDDWTAERVIIASNVSKINNFLVEFWHGLLNEV